MNSHEDRIQAVKLYIKLGKRIGAFDDKADRHLSKPADLKLTFVFGIRFGVRPTPVQRERASVLRQ